MLTKLQTDNKVTITPDVFKCQQSICCKILGFAVNY